MSNRDIYPPSVCPGIPRIKKVPAGWNLCTYESIFSKEVRPISLDLEKEYELIIAKRNRGGIVSRGKLQGKNIKTPSQFLVKGGDFLISKRQIVHGACGIVPMQLDGAVVSNEYLVLRPTDIITASFLKWLPHSSLFQKSCFQSSVGVDIEKMLFRWDEFIKFKTLLPNLSEQKIISQILDFWEKSIEDCLTLIAIKRKLKKGLMQKLLSNVDKNKKVKIREFSDINSGGTPSTSNPLFWEKGSIPWMRSGDIHQKRICHTDSYITDEGLKNSSAKLIPLNSVLIALAGQGKTRGTVGINLIELASNQSVAAIIIKRWVYPDYLLYYLEDKYNELRTISLGDGGRGGLNLTIIGNIEIPIPPENVQKEIGGVLASIDEEIDLLQKKTELLEKQKKVIINDLLLGEKRLVKSKI